MVGESAAQLKDRPSRGLHLNIRKMRRKFTNLVGNAKALTYPSAYVLILEYVRMSTHVLVVLLLLISHAKEILVAVILNLCVGYIRMQRKTARSMPYLEAELRQ
jgi:hypothetical protein